MPVKISVDAELLAQAMAISGLSEEAVIERALKELIARQRRRRAIEELKGLGWEGDLDEMRTDRS